MTGRPPAFMPLLEGMVGELHSEVDAVSIQKRLTRIGIFYIFHYRKLLDRKLLAELKKAGEPILGVNSEYAGKDIP
jgi:hypothetical protein